MTMKRRDFLKTAAVAAAAVGAAKVGIASASKLPGQEPDYEPNGPLDFDSEPTGPLGPDGRPWPEPVITSGQVDFRPQLGPRIYFILSSDPTVEKALDGMAAPVVGSLCFNIRTGRQWTLTEDGWYELKTKPYQFHVGPGTYSITVIDDIR